jgi:hypothetical protein
VTSLVNGAGALMRLGNRSLQRAEAQYSSQDGVEKAKCTARITPILPSSVVAIVVAAPETFAEVILILSQTDVVSVVSEGRILVCETIVVIKPPMIITVRLAGPHTFFIAEPQSPP